MKKLIFIIFLCMICYSASEARNIAVFTAGTTAVAGACADSSCAGFLICQNFETATTGYDNSETWVEDAGTPEAAYATSPLRGSQSLHIAPGDTVYTDIGSQTEVYLFFRIKFAEVAPLLLSDTIEFRDSSFQKLYQIAIDDNSKFYVYNGGWNIDTLSTGTPYYVWAHFKNGTGNAVLELYVSTTKTKPATPGVSVTDYTQTTAMQYFWVYGSNTVDYTIDQILIKTTDIGDVCD
jgi:hypothetical protein